jgi:cytochrome P450
MPLTFFFSNVLGDVVYANLAGTPIVILNSLTAARATLESKGSKYSDRREVPFARLAGHREFASMMDDGPGLRAQRRLLAQGLGSHAQAAAYVPMVEARTRAFLLRLAHTGSGAAEVELQVRICRSVNCDMLGGLAL